MNITIIKYIRDKYHSGWPRKQSKVNQIVIHGTAGGHNATDLLSWMFNSGRKGYKSGIGLFHYAIDKTGDVYEIISPDRWVYHSTSGAHDKTTIGIELINSSKDNADKYTREQYHELYKLFKDLRERGYKINSFIGHGRCGEIYSRQGKNCPGNFNWLWLEERLTDDGFTFINDGKEYIRGIS